MNFPKEAVMSKTAQMQIRLDPALKADAEGILDAIGLSPTEFVRMAMRQLVMRRGLPFDARIPNEETVAAIGEPREGLRTYTDPDAMMSDILGGTD